MKKAIALALIAAMTLSMTACTSSANKGGASEPEPAQEAAAEEKTEEAAPAETAEEAPANEASEGSEDPGAFYPAGSVVYRSSDPAADINAAVSSTDQITWTVAACLTEDNPQSVALKHIGEDLERLTNGNFKWDIFYNSQLGSESEAVELVRNNTAQFVTSNVTVMSPYVDDFGIFALPYLFHSEEDMLTYLQDSDVAKSLYQKLEDTAGLVTLGFNCTGTRCLSTTGIPQFKSPEELKGAKVRSMEAQVWQNVISCLGATPVPVAYTELYTALQTGVVQGQDNPVANTVDGKFYEVLDTFYETDHAYLVSGYYTNPASWDALPDDYKAVLEGLMSKYMGGFYHQEILKFQDSSKKVMTDAGVTIVPQADLDMDAFYASAENMINENYANDPAYADYIKDVKEFFGY